jgi:3-isopropylmalate/(R)-2-methylmalate dehydratase small subunit
MRLRGSVLSLPFDGIDTDQIIPAIHLTVIEPGNLGRFLFTGSAELRERLAGAPQATILVAGSDFGCGSSREHAAWALVERGFRAAIAPSFARIFLENAYNNGIVPIVLEPWACAASARSAALDIDLERNIVKTDAGEAFSFSLDPLRKTFLSGGGYLRYLHRKIPAIRAWQKARVRVQLFDAAFPDAVA